MRRLWAVAALLALPSALLAQSDSEWSHYRRTPLGSDFNSSYTAPLLSTRDARIGARPASGRRSHAPRRKTPKIRALP